MVTSAWLTLAFTADRFVYLGENIPTIKFYSIEVRQRKEERKKERKNEKKRKISIRKEIDKKEKRK